MKKRLPSPVILAIMTTITTVSWVGFSVYRTLTKKPLPNVPVEILEPISPELDTNTLAQIAERVYFERGSTVAFSSASATIEIEEEVIAEEDATSSSTPNNQATESGELE